VPKIELIQGDCLEKLKELPDESVDAIVTDPPYELGFMGKKWDASGITYNIDLWKECLRVLKPGGHLLAFGGTRTYHRMAVAIEDAGFEVRDMLEWIYFSGFPKSLNIGKAVDKKNDRFYDKGFQDYCNECRNKKGYSHNDVNKLIGSATTGGGFSSSIMGDKEFNELPTKEMYSKLKPILEMDDRYDELIERTEREREVIGNKPWDTPVNGFLPDGRDKSERKQLLETKGNSEWEGFGTALKPAHESICMARKPLSEKTIVDNVFKHGTGAIDIDGCRIPIDNQDHIMKYPYAEGKYKSKYEGGTSYKFSNVVSANTQGRFPANIICTDDALNDGVVEKGIFGGNSNAGSGMFKFGEDNNKIGKKCGFGDSGSKSRYFDIDVWGEKYGLLQFPKASKRERNEGCEGLEEKQTRNYGAGKGMNKRCTICNGWKFGEYNTCKCENPNFIEASSSNLHSNFHPCVKPVHLMSWLVRLVSKEGDTVLDPFVGSGTTGVACVNLNRNFIGIELDPEYFRIAEKRIGKSIKSPKHQCNLFQS